MTPTRIFLGLFVYLIFSAHLPSAFAQVVTTETNANRMIEICLVNPQSLSVEPPLDFNRDVVIRLSYYERSYTPRDSREDWQPRAFDKIQTRVIDQFPNHKLILQPVEAIQIGKYESLVIFQKDPTFFSGHEEVLLHISADYDFLFHFGVSEFFGENG